MTKRLLRDATLLSTSDVAEQLALSKVHVTRLVKSGDLSAIRIGGGRLASLAFDPAEVQRLRAIRVGEPGEDRSAYRRECYLSAIKAVVARTGGTFHLGQLREHLPEDAAGPQAGALISGLVRGHRIEWTGAVATSGDARNRHGLTPCKVYRVVGDLA